MSRRLGRIRQLDALGPARTMNRLPLFSLRLEPAPEWCAGIRGVLERLVEASMPDMRATAYCALRYAGHEGSIAAIDREPPLLGAQAGTERNVKRVVAKRMEAAQ